MFKRIGSILGLVAVLSAGAVAAASIPYFSTAQVDTPIGMINALIQQIDSLVTPQSMAPFNNFRNVLDNGAMQVQQRGTGIRTCATTSTLASTAYSTDRWACDVNVSSGAGRSVALTSSLPPGFVGGVSLYRTSGALTQPACIMQEIPGSRSTSLQGQAAVLSFYAKDLGGLVADNGGVIAAHIVTGTGAEQGFGTWTASPAITPAWTGVATLTPTLNNGSAVTSAWARYTATVAYLPAAATEIAVQICFTPTAAGAGVTDGIALTGVQLEQVSGGATAASPFEFRPYGLELVESQRYYWQVVDGAATLRYGTCQVILANTTAVCNQKLPQEMRATPAIVIGTAQSFGITASDGTADTCTTLAVTTTGSTPDLLSLTCTTGATIAVTVPSQFIGAATGGINTFSADF